MASSIGLQQPALAAVAAEVESAVGAESAAQPSFAPHIGEFAHHSFARSGETGAEPSSEGTHQGAVAIGPPKRPHRPVPANQSAVNSRRTYQQDGQEWVQIVQACPHYHDSSSLQHMLAIGQRAPGNAVRIFYSAIQTVKVRVLKGGELGALQGKSQAQIGKMLDSELLKLKAFYRSGRVPNPKTNRPFASLSQAQAYSVADHYYGSGPHLSACAAAAARSGGKIPAIWFMNDPFMGRAGSNAEYFPDEAQGLFPGITAKIGVAHDADYMLGSMFGAGPLGGLNATKAPVDGKEGLQPGLQSSPSKDYPIYSVGHPDWNVETTLNSDYTEKAP